MALALILFDGGLKTRFQSIRAVLAPSMVLATVGVLLTALITAPVAKYALDLNWTEALLVGAVVASTDAAAVFLLVHAQGLRLRPRVGATLEVESGTNDPFAVFLTLVLVEFISIGESSVWQIALEFTREAVLGAIVGVVGGRLVVLALNRVALPQGLHAPFVATAALVIFGAAQIVACLRISRGLSRRHHHRQPADPRAQFGGDVSRRRDLAGADRDVRAARPAGLAAAAGRAASFRR